jgi:CRISPR-associated protein Cas5d
MHSRRFHVRARGCFACFTRPEMKAERVSYEVMTPSAARGLLEAILWKPAVRWHVHSIAVLKPICWQSFRRNEVNDRASPKILDFYADERRAQRNTVALRDVDYVIEASFALTDKAGPDDNMTKFEEMFDRRLRKGQTFQQPYLGCREMAAKVEPATEPWKPLDDKDANKPLGLMLYDFLYNPEGGSTRALFFEARLRDGVLEVPPLADVLRDNARPQEAAR